MPLRVTQVLRLAGLVDTTHFNDFARDRGTAVHTATQYLDEGDLDWDTLGDEVRPYVEQYQRWKEECRPTIHRIELEVKYPSLGYAGRLDRCLTINRRDGVLDIKCGGPAPWHGVQLAGYSMALGWSVPTGALARWVLYLNPNGYKLVECKDRNDYKVWKAALTIAQWAKETGK
jgi:hypothetical protein